MNADTKEISAIVPGEENEEDREQMVKKIAGETIEHTEDEEEHDETPRPRPSRKRFVLAFGVFVAGCVLLIGTLSWFFGIGLFSGPQPQPVNRTAKTDTAAPVTEEEKLRMAVSMLAEKPVTQRSPEMVETEQTKAPSVIDLPPEITQVSGADTALPQPSPFSSTSEQPRNQPATRIGDRPESSTPETETAQSSSERIREASSIDLQIIGRSVFFGREKETALKVEATPKTAAPSQTSEPEKSVRAIPFGTLLPIRLLGGVQTIGSSAGYVRMELSQPFEKEGLSYPAGTTVVGTLRKSESSRAFITVVGLIHPSSGALIKFNGEILGPDGASGLPGRKRNTKSALSRTLSGLRGVGTAALGAVGSWRSGGTVLITDSSQKSSEIIANELSAKENKGEFVELAAGTTGYVLVTDLPKEGGDNK